MNSEMDVCLNCQGAIFPPGWVGGWAGAICRCPVHPSRQVQQYQSPSRNPLPSVLPFGPVLGNGSGSGG